MKNKFEYNYKKSNINANSEFDFYQLTKKSNFLFDCELTRNTDGIQFTYTSEFMQAIEEIREATLMNKYQLLINIQYLLEDSKRIMISLAPSNICYDTSFMPKAIERDTYLDTEFSYQDYLNQYKALAAHILQNKYSFEDFYNGGEYLYAKNKRTSPLSKATSIDELIEVLQNENKIVQQTLQTNMIEVDRGTYKRTKVLNKILSIVALLSLISLSYLGLVELSTATNLNTAYEQYIQQDYISVISTLEEMPIQKMSQNTKYVLSVSNIRSESLTDQQKNNILAGATINADYRILDYWVNLGKSNYDEAIDIAKQLGNDEYLAFAYMKEKAYVESDSLLTGEERQEQLEALDKALESIELEE